MSREHVVALDEIRENFATRGRSKGGGEQSKSVDRPRANTPDEMDLLESQRASDQAHGQKAIDFNTSYLRYEANISTAEDDAAILPGIRKFSIPLKPLAGLYISRGGGILEEELKDLRAALDDGSVAENQRLTKFMIHSNSMRGAAAVGKPYTRSGLASTTTWDPKAVAYSANRIRRYNEKTGEVEPMAVRVVFDILIDENNLPKGYAPDMVLLGPHNEVVPSDENTYTTLNIAEPDAEGVTRIQVRASGVK